MLNRVVRGFVLILFVMAVGMQLFGCGATSTTMNDTSTVHNREATRIWIIRRNTDGEITRDQVVFCDISMAQAGRDLCMSWGR